MAKGQGGRDNARPRAPELLVFGKIPLCEKRGISRKILGRAFPSTKRFTDGSKKRHSDSVREQQSKFRHETKKATMQAKSRTGSAGFRSAAVRFGSEGAGGLERSRDFEPGDPSEDPAARPCKPGKAPLADGSKGGAMTSARGAVDLAKRQGYEKHGTIGPVALHWIDFLSRKTAMLEAESRGTVRGRFGCLEWNRLTFRAANLPREPAS